MKSLEAEIKAANTAKIWIGAEENYWIQAHSARKDLLSAKEALDKMKSMNDLAISSCWAFIASFWKEEPDVSRLLFELLKSKSKKIPSSNLYTTMLASVAAQGDLRAAMEFKKEMTDNQIPISELSYKVLIDAFVRNGEMDKASQIMEEMAKNILDPVAPFNALIHAYAKLDKMDGVRETLQQMKDAGLHPNGGTYSALKSARNKTEALEIFGEMWKDDNGLDEHFYEAMIDQHCRIGRIDDAWNMYLEKKKAGMTLSAHSVHKLLAYVARHNLESAYELLAELERQGATPTDSDYAVIISKLGEMKDLDAIQRIRDKMSAAGVSMTNKIYRALIQAHSNAGDYKTARMLSKGAFQDIERKDAQSKEHTDLILLGAAHNPHLALQRYHEMRSKQQKFTHSHAPTALMDALMKRGRTEEAMGVFRDMISDKHNLTIVPYNVIINGIANMDADRVEITSNDPIIDEFVQNIKQPDSPFQLLDALRQKGIEPTIITYNTLIKIQIKHRPDMDNATKLAEDMVEHGIQYSEPTCLILIRGHLAKEQPDQAVALVDALLKKGIKQDRFIPQFKIIKMQGKEEELNQVLSRYAS